jgi:DNA-binding NarL/FixJ family response regulator
VLCDDERELRGFVKRRLDRERDLEVVGDAPDTAACQRMVDDLGPDVVVLDLSMPRGHGLDAIGPLSATGAAVVVYSGLPAAEYSESALARGASAFIAKSGPVEDLVDAVRRVSAA